MPSPTRDTPPTRRRSSHFHEESRRRWSGAPVELVHRPGVAVPGAQVGIRPAAPLAARHVQRCKLERPHCRGTLERRRLSRLILQRLKLGLTDAADRARNSRPSSRLASPGARRRSTAARAATRCRVRARHADGQCVPEHADARDVLRLAGLVGLHADDVVSELPARRGVDRGAERPLDRELEPTGAGRSEGELRRAEARKPYIRIVLDLSRAKARSSRSSQGAACSWANVCRASPARASASSARPCPTSHSACSV